MCLWRLLSPKPVEQPHQEAEDPEEPILKFKSVMTFIRQLDRAEGYSESWQNLLSGCVCRCLQKTLGLESAT